jgi:hypothetical protein
MSIRNQRRALIIHRIDARFYLCNARAMDLLQPADVGEPRNLKQSSSIFSDISVNITNMRSHVG